MSEKNKLDERTFMKSHQSVKSYTHKGNNLGEKTLFQRCFIGHATFGKVFSFFWKSVFFEKVDFWSDELPTLRVGRSVTRFTVYWAFPSRMVVL